MQKVGSLSLKPNSVGVGLRHTHFPYLETISDQQVDFFEIISENFMNTKGRPRKILDHVRSLHPIAMHGVSLSVASSDPLNTHYIKKIKDFSEEIDPVIISDHLCWTGGSAHNLHNLLPFPYTKESLDHVCDRVNQVQEILGRSLCLENLSAYLEFNENDFDEIEFMNQLCKRTGCGILFDFNNLYVNSKNLGFDASKELDRVNFSFVKQIHLAGFSDFGTHLFDTHSREVQPEVWYLFQNVARKIRNIPILVEWDEDIPDFETLKAEATKARSILEENHES